jgi:UDP-N-acetylmuramoyl-tripeptide--D-alanyl-D-alanine ligase
MRCTLGEAAAAMKGDLSGGPPELEVRGVSTDSRTTSPGNLFVALRGPNFDGHDFAGAAQERGAVAAVVHRAVEARMPVVRAPETLRALGDLAAWHRRRSAAKVVAVTGSAGKTTTKEMIAAVLARLGPTLATQGNLNNLVGVPHTLFGLSPEHRYAVVEMGMSAQGEIARLAEIARPDVGVITNVGLAHGETAGGLEGVARAKGELFAALGPDDHAAVNLDDPRIAALRPTLRARAITYGRAEGAEVRLMGDPEVTFQGTRARVRVRGAVVDLSLPQIGVHQAENALAAMAATLPLGATPMDMAEGLRQSGPVAGRMTVRHGARLTVLDDTYNANPRSVAVALETLARLSRGRRAVAVLGDMLELGEDSVEAHRGVGREAARAVAALFAFGPRARDIARSAREAGLSEVWESEDAAEMSRLLGEHLRDGDVVLFKGSRGMRMERLVGTATGQVIAGGP